MLASSEETGPQEQFKVSPEALSQLKLMGFGENRSIRALTQYKNDVERACNWLFEKMDDTTLDAPIEQPKTESQQKQNKDIFVSQENIDFIVAMNFSAKAAKFALTQTDNNLERAIDYILSHENVGEDEPAQVQEEVKSQQKEQSEQVQDKAAIYTTKYDLHAVIVHLGKSTQAGHYTTYIKHGG